MTYVQSLLSLSLLLLLLLSSPFVCNCGISTKYLLTQSFNAQDCRLPHGRSKSCKEDRLLFFFNGVALELESFVDDDADADADADAVWASMDAWRMINDWRRLGEDEDMIF